MMRTRYNRAHQPGEMTMRRSGILFSIGLSCLLIPGAGRADDAASAMVPVGVAVVDVTPSYPLRLMGYGSRKTESEGVASPLKVRALVIGDDAGKDRDEGPAVLITVDNCAVGAFMTDEVARRLAAKARIRRERLVTCATHTHCAPALASGLDFIFGAAIPADQRARIERYTRELIDAMEKVALQALAARQPGRLAWGQGSVGFAANRRVLKEGKWVGFGVNPNGPVDHSLPVLRVTDAAGKVKAALVNYACHCTTLGGEFNKICAEWAGFACDDIEQQNPGAIALVVIGCGADANPEPRRNLDDAKNHAAALSREANRLLASSLSPLPGRVTAAFKQVELPLAARPGREALDGAIQAGRFRGDVRPVPAREAGPRRDAAVHGALPRASLVVRRRHGHGLPGRRGRRRLRPPAQVGDRRHASLGHRLQQ